MFRCRQERISERHSVRSLKVRGYGSVVLPRCTPATDGLDPEGGVTETGQVVKVSSSHFNQTYSTLSNYNLLYKKKQQHEIDSVQFFFASSLPTFVGWRRESRAIIMMYITSPSSRVLQPCEASSVKRRMMVDVKESSEEQRFRASRPP